MLEVHWLQTATKLLSLGLALFALLSATRGTAAGFDLKPIPEPVAAPDWLVNCQRFSFDIKSADQARERDLQALCGPTNAGSVGYAGGPWMWDGKDGFYDIFSFKPVDLAPYRAQVDLAHKKGLKVIGELIRMWDPVQLYLEHPEWQELPAPDARPRGPERKNEWPPVTGCWNSPFGERYIRHCVEMARAMDLDGFNLDGFGCWAQCYCPACRAAYKADTGKDIPYVATVGGGEPGIQTTTSGDLNDPEFRRYLKWRLNRWNLFTDKWVRALDAVKPGFAMLFWSTGPGRWWHWGYAPLIESSDAANRLLQGPIVELFWDFPPDQGSNLLPSFTTRYYRGLVAERPVWMLPYFCTQGQQVATAPPAECDFRVLTVITNGAHCAQGVWMHSDAIAPDRFSKLIKEREPWLNGARSVKWAAMLISESSRLLYGVPGKRKEIGNSWIGSGVDTPDKVAAAAGERRLPAHMESAIGIFRVAQEEHLPLDMIVEQDVEDAARLASYKLLILPNSACLSEKALDNIRRFVQSGGGLVALHESSLCDEFGSRRPDFGLADLFGASFVEVEDHTARWPNYPHSTYLAIGRHEITSSDVIKANYRHAEDIIDYIGLTCNVRAKDGAQVPVIRSNDPAKLHDPFSTPEALRKTGGDKAPDEHPFLVLSNAGSGRVAYFAADIGQSYFVAPYQYERALVANAMRWAAGKDRPPVEIEAPMCVQSTAYTQEGGKRVIVHLLNEINTSANRALPEGNSSMREEVLPIHGIKVSCRAPGMSRATLQPENLKLAMDNRQGLATVTVPVLNLHSMVVFEK